MVQINVGAAANDGTGDTLRAAFQKVNANTTELGVSITTTSDSTFNGVKVGRGNGNLATNTVVGLGSSFTTGARNTLLGNSAGYQISSGEKNTIIGTAGAAVLTIGSFNTIIGEGAGAALVSENYNTFLGVNAGSLAAAGSNTYVGVGAGQANVSFTNTSAFGFTSAVTGNNQVQLGNASTTTYVYGTVQNRSDLRDKADVQDTVLGLDFISKLRPVDYKWDMREDYKSELPIQGELSDEDFKVVMDAWLIDNKLSNLKQDGTKKRNRFHHGFIAQEIRDLGIDFGGFQNHYINDGEDVLSIGYDEFIAPMVKAIQELKAEIELLKAK
jgi:hypothetical protein